MRKPAALPPALRGRAFTVAEAAALGVGRRRTRADDLDRSFRGIRSPAGELGLTELCRAYARRMPADQYFSHATAAALHGLPIPARLAGDPTVHVAAIASRQPRARRVSGHLDREGFVRTIGVRGLRVATPVDTWCALASILTVTELVIMGDALVRRKKPLSTMEELASAVERWGGRRGCRRLRHALVLVRPGTDSPKETDIRVVIVGAGLPEPAVNHRIVSGHGVFLALGDLAYPLYKVLIEYDGATHFGNDSQAYHDIDRLDAVMAERWRVIRLNKTHSPAAIIAKIRRALIDAGWTP